MPTVYFPALFCKRKGLSLDFVMFIKTENPYSPRVWLENDENSMAALLTFYPKFTEKQVVNEIILVVDCSGSMS